MPQELTEEQKEVQKQIEEERKAQRAELNKKVATVEKAALAFKTLIRDSFKTAMGGEFPDPDLATDKQKSYVRALSESERHIDYAVIAARKVVRGH